MSDTSLYPQTRQPNSRGFYGFGNSMAIGAMLGDPLGVDPTLQVEAVPLMADTTTPFINPANYNLGVSMPTSQLLIPVGLTPQRASSTNAVTTSSGGPGGSWGLVVVGLLIAGGIYYFKKKK